LDLFFFFFFFFCGGSNFSGVGREKIKGELDGGVGVG